MHDAIAPVNTAVVRHQ